MQIAGDLKDGLYGVMIMVLMIFSKLFITCDVNATGRKSLGLAGRDFLGTGTTIDVFHKVGNLCKLREA